MAAFKQSIIISQKTINMDKKKLTWESWVNVRLAENGWQQKELADRIGIRGNFKSTVINNPKLAIVNKVLTAFGEVVTLDGNYDLK